VILLDTHAILWLDRQHRRGRVLDRFAGRLYASPASLLEIQVLSESGRVRLRRGLTPAALAQHPRWLLDDPPSTAWFEEAWTIPWAHDPFDRLLVAHARHRGWKLATADGELIEHLTASEVLEL
jgi:PIN domain nuclease of toxin-antitoxin system